MLKNYLSEITYGGIDGIITTLAIIAGSTGAKLSNNIIFTLGIANVIADGFSMGISSYLAEKARKVNKNELMVGIVTFVSFVTIGILPVLPYLIGILKSKHDKEDLNKKYFLYSCIITGILLFLIGFSRGKMINGIESLLVGGFAGFIAFNVSKYIKKQLG